MNREDHIMGGRRKNDVLIIAPPLAQDLSELSWTSQGKLKQQKDEQKENEERIRIQEENKEPIQFKVPIRKKRNTTNDLERDEEIDMPQTRPSWYKGDNLPEMEEKPATTWGESGTISEEIEVKTVPSWMKKDEAEDTTEEEVTVEAPEVDEAEDTSEEEVNDLASPEKLQELLAKTGSVEAITEDEDAVAEELKASELEAKIAAELEEEELAKEAAAEEAAAAAEEEAAAAVVDSLEGDPISDDVADKLDEKEDEPLEPYSSKDVKAFIEIGKLTIETLEGDASLNDYATSLNKILIINDCSEQAITHTAAILNNKGMTRDEVIRLSMLINYYLTNP